MKISTRPETPEDEPFLRRLVLDTIAEQIHPEIWPPGLRESVLSLQSKIRREGSLSAYPNAASEIIMANRRVGWWWLSFPMRFVSRRSW
jgi:hypothetical protein